MDAGLPQPVLFVFAFPLKLYKFIYGLSVWQMLDLVSEIWSKTGSETVVSFGFKGTISFALPTA